MATKNRYDSEREQAGSSAYLSNERACQGDFSYHPRGMPLTAHRFVEALDRWTRTALHAFPRDASGRGHVTALVGGRSGP
jgi:hypothetical protein